MTLEVAPLSKERSGSPTAENLRYEFAGAGELNVIF